MGEIRKGKSSVAKLFKNVKRIRSEFKILICSFSLNLFLLLISRVQKGGKKFSFIIALRLVVLVVSSSKKRRRDKMNLSIFNINSK